MELRAFFEKHHLLRRQEGAGPIAAIAPPAVAYGRGDLRRPPNPDEHGYHAPLEAMSLLDYHRFIGEWLVAAADTGRVRCAACDRGLAGTGEPDVWRIWAADGAYVCWLPVHAACRRSMNRALGLLTPPIVTPTLRVYDVSALVRAERP
jgi:hypothetical protein